jgi:uncharacterized YigZ family protein
MAAEEYLVPAAAHRVEQVIERSRFIATLGHAPTAEAARSFIDGVRAEFPDATHNCWAYVAGAAGGSAHSGMSDAGEPHGTAGRPMLDVLLHSGVGEVVAVVTRYYGGIKLGKGGLVRAYGGAVQHALETLPTLRRVERVGVAVTLSYADVDAVRRSLLEVAAELRDESYGESVRYAAAVPAGELATLERLIADRTAGRATIAVLDRGSAASGSRTTNGEMA